jgi:hypothetical protein
MKTKSLLVIQKDVHLKTHRNPSPNIKRKPKHKTLTKTRNPCITQNLQKHETTMFGISNQEK